LAAVPAAPIRLPFAFSTAPASVAAEEPDRDQDDQMMRYAILRGCISCRPSGPIIV
jgi:hypothetical protein